MQFFYEVPCSICQKTFKLLEGTAQYKLYKVNRTRKFQCEMCTRKIEDDSRKYLFDRD